MAAVSMSTTTAPQRPPCGSLSGPRPRRTLERAQAALRARGLYRGEEDGVYSPQMRDALRAYQRSANLYETGVPDPATLWTLLNP